jgi:hypothetical protein
MMRSASVLLPWSMWAMIEKLRMWSIESIKKGASKSGRAFQQNVWQLLVGLSL